MMLVGYLLAVGLQTLFGAGYTRLGRKTLMTADDCWTPTYFGLTGFAWIVSMAIATFTTLPLAEVAGGRQSGLVSLMLDILLILMVIYRNRKQNPRQQSITITAILSACIVIGSIIGAIARVHHPAIPS
jgi:peptidoglycan biosynthesis protein MviN/MurJ (putative lipid II flippase)